MLGVGINGVGLRRQVKGVASKLGAAVAAAYSPARRLNDTYTGPAIRVRRSSDNAEADIGFGVNGSLDEQALMSHVGAENLLLWSEQFGNDIYVKDRTAINTNSLVAPDGTLTADRIYETSTANLTYRAYQNASVTAIQQYTFSVYLKAGEKSWAYLRAFDSKRVWFDLANGVIGTVDSGLSAAISNAGNGWYRCSVTNTPQSTGGLYSLVGLAPNNGVELYIPATGTDGIYAWGAQLNTGSTALDYCKTEGATRTSGQNFALHSEAVDNAYWNKFVFGTGVAPAVTADFAAAPNGATTAERVVLNRGAGTTADDYSLVGVDPTGIPSGVQYTGSVYLKSNTAAAQNVVIYGEGVGKVVSVPTTWTRFEFTATSDGTPSIVIGTRGGSSFYSGGDAQLDILVWGAQINEGYVALPYKATTTAAINNGSGFVTRVYEQSFKGAELVTDPEILQGTTHWPTTAGTGTTYSNGTISIPHDAGVSSQGLSVVVGAKYKVTIKRTGATKLRIHVGSTIFNGTSSAWDQGFDDVDVFEFTAKVATVYINIANVAGAGTIGVLDSVTAREVRDLTQTTAANQPRIVFAGMMDRMYVAENLLKHSNDFTTANWTRTAITLSSVGIGPDGMTPATRLVGGTGWSLKQSPPTAVRYVQSIYVKSNTGSNQNVYFWNGSAAVTHTVTSEWKRIEAITSPDNGQFDFYGDAGADILISQAQLNTGSTASPYVKTDATAIKLGDRHPLNKPAIRTDGVSQNLKSGAFALPTNTSVCVTGKFSSNKPLFIEHGPNANSTAGFYLYGTGNQSWMVYRDAATHFGTLANWMGENANTVIFSYDGIGGTVFKNGERVNMSVGGSPRTNSESVQSFNVGSRDGIGVFTNGHFGDIIILPKSLGGKPNDKELVSNGTFDTNTNGWTNVGTATHTFSNGTIEVTTDGGGGNFASQTVVTQNGKMYEFAASARAGSATARFGVEGKMALETTSTVMQQFSFRFIATSTEHRIFLRTTAAGTAYYDNISVREVLPDQDRVLNIEADMNNFWGIK